MGPDCGTAIVNGVPLGFANVVRRGDIGLVAASGTGLQEVTCRIHNLGGGVSQALGTGGRDLKEEIGGITMLQGLAALADDPATRVIVLISKPPAPAIARQISDAAARGGQAGRRALPRRRRPSACAAGPASRPNRCGMRPTSRWRSRRGEAPPASGGSAADGATRRRRRARRRAWRRRSTAVRGLFTGGTFCYEAQLAFLARGLAVPLQRAGRRRRRRSTARFDGHVFIDMGDDDYTRGRPHPMIDPSLRNAAVRTQRADPHTAAILFDVVLGFGSHADPAGGLGAGARGRAARGARAGTHAGADRPRLRHRRRSAGQGRAGARSSKRRARSSPAATVEAASWPRWRALAARTCRKRRARSR